MKSNREDGTMMHEISISEMSLVGLQSEIDRVKGRLAHLRYLRSWGYVGDGEPIGLTIRRMVQYKKELNAELKERKSQNKSK